MGDAERKTFQDEDFGKIRHVWKVINKGNKPRAEPFPLRHKQTEAMLAGLSAGADRFQKQLAEAAPVLDSSSPFAGGAVAESGAVASPLFG